MRSRPAIVARSSSSSSRSPAPTIGSTWSARRKPTIAPSTAGLVGALKRPLLERFDLLVQRAAQRADAVLGHAVDAELLDQPVDLPGRHAVDVGLEHHGDERLPGAPTRLQEAREVRRAGPLAGNQQLDLADPRLPRPGATAVAVRHPLLGRDLAELSAHLGGVGSAASRRCPACAGWFARRRPPNRTCEFPRIRLSTGMPVVIG
jgi:hypothetical protein